MIDPLVIVIKNIADLSINRFLSLLLKADFRKL
jgi:hypothetical protein